MKLLGPQNRDDLWFMYNLNQGRINIPDKVVYEGKDDKDVTRGLLNLNYRVESQFPDSVSVLKAGAKSIDFAGIPIGTLTAGTDATHDATTASSGVVWSSGTNKASMLKFPTTSKFTA